MFGFLRGARRKMTIETISYNKVVENNRTGVDAAIEKAVDAKVRATALAAMEKLWEANKTRKRFADIARLIEKSPWKDSGFGVYFATVANMKTTYGPRILPAVNETFNSNWENPVEIGSGVGTIVPYRGSIELLQAGIANPNLLTQYDSPGGTYPSRWAGATILNTKIGEGYALESPLFTVGDTYITPSATYAIDIAYDAFARSRKEQGTNNRVIIVGPSYYVLALSATDKGLPVERVYKPKEQTGNIRSFFPTPEELQEQMPQDTGMLVLTLPNNPNGETYGDTELRKLFELAKRKDLLLLLDLVFDQLLFQNKVNYPVPASPLRVALETGMLDQTIIVDGLSKSLNLAGERVGILATKNKTLERIINAISVSRLSNPSLTVEPLLQFEALSRVLDTKVAPDTPTPAVNLAAELTRRDLEKLTANQWLEEISAYKLSEWYRGREQWLKDALQYYRDNLTIIDTVLSQSKRRSILSPNDAAYNTFVGLGETKGNRGFDKILKLFLLTGIVSMSGQCFGIKDGEDEFWTRITYGGLSREVLPEVLTRLMSFLDLWDEMDLSNPQKFPVFDREFKII